MTHPGMTGGSLSWVCLGFLLLLSPLPARSSDSKETFASNWHRSSSKGSSIHLFDSKGLSSVDGISKALPQGWQLHKNFSGFLIESNRARKYLKKFYGDFVLTFTSHLVKKSQGSLLTLKHKKHRLPHLDLGIDLANNLLVLRYLGAKSYQRIQMSSVFPAWQWSRLHIEMFNLKLLVRVDCMDNKEMVLRQPLADIPLDIQMWFGQKADHQEGLQGMIFDAELGVHALGDDEGCPVTMNNQLVADQPASVTSDFTVKNSAEDRVTFLEQQVAHLSKLVDMLKTQNTDLSSRVSYLETCECTPRCSFNGKIFNEGQTWSPDMCTVCQCQNGRPRCSKRLDVPSCISPCMANPCHNIGSCMDLDVFSDIDTRADNFQCQCQPPFTGPTCQVRYNPCIWPVAYGNCNQQLTRYYYDQMSQQCLPFNYTGCGGNVNNYENIQQCVSIAMEGACCYRTFNISKDAVVKNQQQMQILCKVLHLGDCQALHRPQGGLDEMEKGIVAVEETEVVSFYPGLSCEEAGCIAPVKKCTVGQTLYSSGESINLGCQQCICQENGVLNCSCSQMTMRREIRDMTREEVVHFQQAVAKLRLGADEQVWEQFRDLYMTHRMHASGAPYFLPWHRLFLRQVEQKLQEIDCNIVLPYFDFTTDVGNFGQALVWQANYFGSSGNSSNASCVPDHPFGDPKAWQPCLMRQFDTSVQLPTQVELAMALASDDYMDMSMCLESAVAYVHAYIGGDMMAASGPYDPIFYAVHSFIDMLYWTWQQKPGNKFQFPAAYGNIPLVPFNVLPWQVLDSEASLCVTYALPSKGSSCNITDLSRIIPEHTTHLSPDQKRGDIPVKPEEEIEVVELDLFGYDADGFDLSGFDRFGFNRKGYNRDGYNRAGYDVVGFDRYGFDEEGYSFDGFNKSGKDREGHEDSTGRFSNAGYDAFCFSRQGLNPQGYDQYGFTEDGYDADFCNFHFNGPFAPLQSFQIFQILRQQTKPFLMSLSRTCSGLSAVPDIWLKQTWVTERKVIAGMVNIELPSSFISIPAQRFCFRTDIFVTACPCDKGIALCQENPCQKATCPAFPEAKCYITFCGECQARWIHEGKEVDCTITRNFCSPNPCQHGGECIESEWPNEPQQILCVCPPGYDGHRCQYLVEDVCNLPLSTGSCEQQEMKWYYNYKTASCEKFVYTGCQGNANSFPSAAACESRCVVGACCFREPLAVTHHIGFDKDGFNKYGFNLEGVNRLGVKQTVDIGTATGRQRFGQMGYDWQGFDREGFNKQGVNRYGYNRQGYNQDGFNLTGYSRIGEYDGIIDYDSSGYDAEGFNREGFNCHGYNRLGYDVYGTLQGFKYKCRVLTRLQCEQLESSQTTVEVVKFTAGKQCSQVVCGEHCGCHHGGKTYSVGEEFRFGCQTCICMEGGETACVCDYSAKRKEVRELTRLEMDQYQAAVRKLTTETGYPSQWFNFASLYASHKPQAVGSPSFLPWHRRFLLEVEHALQAIDCRVSIPYYDWTLDVGDLGRAPVWAANMFGGNGGRDGCVRYHPFKNYYPYFLAPCLRRHFNESVSLPDAVNVQLALNEQNYERFRIHMEMFLELFQVFVGGHMETDYAPYDPIFYSVAAFVDKLWDDWQRKYDDGLLRYPLHRRFVPLAPFEETPDSVMDSRLQLCVEYLPLLDGAPCNRTSVTNFGYDIEGFDRHGYNQNGFDRDGYTIKGVNAEGNPDTRGIFNKYGYNKDGFGRSGYDQIGFDQHGFYVDSYNLDGYNAFGYDRSGYDRYGFDWQGYTPFDFHKNGSYKPEVVKTDLQIFDPYGYNIYGYNKFGFDRDGYDVFGFDANGLNRRICNYYHLGPVYILVKRMIEEKLKTLNEDKIRLVHRICSDMSPLPEYHMRNSWLYRQGQNDALNEIYVNHLNQHMVDLTLIPRTVSVTSDKTWLPVAPDTRLCIMTHAFTPCDLAKPPVLCPTNLCTNVTCPGHPTAVCRTSSCGRCRQEWYDGVTGHLLNCTGCVDKNGEIRKEGQRWTDDLCTTCSCQDGRVVCETLQCDQPACQYPVKLADQCCSSCQGCDYGGHIVPSGHAINSQDPCFQCVCQQGDVACQAVTCVDLGACRSSMVLEGDCCPVCLDCEQYADGDVWSPSPCQRCICQRGEVHCEKIQCPAVKCDHPYTQEGHCCAMCEACFFQGNVYQNGEDFQPDACTLCACRDGSVQCMAQICSNVTCVNPVTPPGQCCPLCDQDCEYEGETYMHNIDFMPSYNPCLNCTCDNSRVRCRSIHCPPHGLRCSKPIPLHGQCCPTVCPKKEQCANCCSTGLPYGTEDDKCFYEGHEYNEGESWPSLSNPCETCECRSSMTVCQPQRSCDVSCSHGVIPLGSCCSACTDCSFDGQIIPDEEKIIVPGPRCQECQCNRGNIMCREMPACSPLPCVFSYLPSGQCCPQCIGCEHQGRSYRYNDIISQTECSTCVCKEGQVMCIEKTDSCPPVQCQNPQKMPGRCCPICTGCTHYGKYYEDGQTFSSQRDPCQRCVCKEGAVTCSQLEMKCPALPCTHPARVREHCCPRCQDCEYQRHLVRNGQRFSPPDGDGCDICRCQEGSVLCERRECPPISCLHSRTQPGQCCPVCPPCLLDGREYREGDIFHRPGDACSICECKGGEAVCKASPCPATPCTHPATLPGECCPQCVFCLYEQRIFRNMQRFLHPDDPCKECSCQQGSVNCQSVVCPRLTCARTMPMVGQCCPSCAKLCEHEGLTYDDGETFTNPRNPCEECLCRQGRVQCKHRTCPQPLCLNPRRDGCCPTCEGCSFGDVHALDGQSFQDPRDSCHTCHCKAGEVTCQPRSCPSAPCQNPAIHDCCPTCQDCDYHGKSVASGTIFNDPRDTCRQCQCVSGNVICQSKLCSPVTCQHPVMRDCCKDCSACLYRGQQYTDGQTFPDAQDPCGECTCTRGTVTCQRRACLHVPCANPTPGPCCPECRNCVYRGRALGDGEVTDHATDPCQQCQCRGGDIHCFSKECPRDQHCRYPVMRQCCAICTDCSFKGREYPNGVEFSDPGTACSRCQCENGDVRCQPVACPKVTCSHPVQGTCCPECSHCSYGNTQYADRQTFPHLTDKCQKCRCNAGSVECSLEECLVISCSHPVTLPGQCCPSCQAGCLYQSHLYRDGESTEQDCQVCTCLQGSVRCQPLQCASVSCSHPVKEGCCPVCNDCLYDGRQYYNGQRLPDRTDRCKECSCRDGTFRCVQSPCPLATCLNPAPGECCPECRDCELGGRIYRYGQNFPDPSDRCSQCVCESGSISCQRAQCDAANCQNPIMDGCGCGSCQGCSYNGLEYRNGQIFASPTDPCQECRCQSGSVSCMARQCNSTCAHPVKTIACCPFCTDCQFEGIVRQQGLTFISGVDPCQQCVCQAGTVQCQTIICPEVNCLKPIYTKHQCCPTCPVCQFLGQTFTDNALFKHPEDSCQKCTCKEGRVACSRETCVVECTHPRQDLCCPRCDMCFFEGKLYPNGQSFQPDNCRRCLCRDGNVVCEEEKCPVLNCLLTEEVPGQCCSQCKGCEYKENTYASNTSFLLPQNPCVTCACTGGLVTCMAMECYVPCDNPVPVPGQCCPVCPTCSYKGVGYKNGEDFSPSDDPCDSCHCEEGHMQCLHETCPSVANCPEENLIDPPPGQCCPSCAGFSTGCTSADIGMMTRPRLHDPCFYCECKEDFTWVCAREQCPILTCPPDVQVTLSGQCCSSCPACYDQSEAHYYHEGQQWSSLKNPCVSCFCQDGNIICSLQECPSLSCGIEERLVSVKGQCCEVCQLSALAECYYQGRTYQPGEEWLVDECTRCQCRGGDVSCTIQNCPLPECKADEVQATSPGNCCPVCLKQPGTCVVFGDPHYRTFDGATLHFQGTCRYIMSKDCEGNNFSVEVQHDNRAAPGDVSWAQNFTVTIGNIIIDLLQNSVVMINKAVVQLPFLYEPHIFLQMMEKTVLLTTDIGLQVSWNGDSHAEVTVPGSYKRKLCGLCGNFNGFPQDDLRTSNGQITNSPAVFGNSWKAETQLTETCRDAQDLDPCLSAGYRVRKIATTRCAVIKGKEFSRCHRVVSPEPYFSSCVYDMCVCMDDPKCLCDILASYAHECARANIRLEWRSHNLCAFTCQEDKGFMFDECGPVCPRTCENLATPLGNLTTNCFKPCVPSCQCTADKVVHNGRCISPSKCSQIHSHTP